MGRTIGARGRLTAGCAAVVLMSSLAACSPAEKASTFPTASSSPAQAATSRSIVQSPTAAPTVKGTSSRPPSRPIRVIDPPGGATKASTKALTIVRSYFAAQLARPSTESSKAMRELAEPNCSQCQHDIDVIEERSRLGQYTVREVGDPTWGSLVYSFRGATGPGLITVRQQYVQPPLRLLSRSGSVVGKTDTAKVYTSLFVVDLDTGWITSRTPVA